LASKIRWEKIEGPLTEKRLQRHGTVLLESQLRSRENMRSFLLSDPLDVIMCQEPGHVSDCLDSLDDTLKQGYAVAGFISYEAGLALAHGQKSVRLHDFPLLWLGIYDRLSFTDAPLLLSRAAPRIPLIHMDGTLIDVTREEFRDAVKSIRKLIEEGDAYQVNYTVRLLAHALQPPLTIYRYLRQSHPVPYGGFLNYGPFSLITQSPELFLKKNGQTLETKPMKGTMPRAAEMEKDRCLGNDLRHSEKDRAENLMIADLMRNDLGRIAVPGSVEVFDAFRVEPLNTLFQMTTGVRAEVEQGVTAGGILRATFPPGSITGAPKVRAMQIISDLEKNPRKAYTGAVGLFLPDGDLVLNVAIRTMIVKEDGSFELGIGSGIVYDSSFESEYDETLLKSRFLHHGHRYLELLETILLIPGSGLHYLHEHLDRMRRSSRTLAFPFSRQDAIKALEVFLGEDPPGPAVVRLRLNRRGDFSVDISPLEPLTSGGKTMVGISSVRMDPADKLLRHKTTSRELFDRELAAGREKNVVEILFMNNNGYLTEGTFTNLFVFDGSGWLTPDVSCGLLPGIWRDEFIRETGASERRLVINDLKSAERVVIGNSVRGMLEVEEVVDEEGSTVFRRPE